MATRNQNESNLRNEDAEEGVQVLVETQKPASFLRALMHVFWIAALFMVFKGISMYVEDRREDAAAVNPTTTEPVSKMALPSQAAPVVPVLDSTKTQGTSSPLPTTTSTQTLAIDVPVPAAFAVSAADVTPAISGKAITKATTCSELKDVLEYWVDIAKKPRSEVRRKWLEERIQDVQAQKAALSCR